LGEYGELMDVGKSLQAPAEAHVLAVARAYGPSIDGSDEPLFELVDRPENCVGLSWVTAEAYLN